MNTIIATISIAAALMSGTISDGFVEHFVDNSTETTECTQMVSDEYLAELAYNSQENQF